MEFNVKNHPLFCYLLKVFVDHSNIESGWKGAVTVDANWRVMATKHVRISFLKQKKHCKKAQGPYTVNRKVAPP